MTDRPVFRGGSEGRRDRAAVALRDNVTPFQKWGSRMFTLGRLQRSYEHVWYLTQSRNDNRRAEFLAALSEAARTHRTVDVFLLAHTNSFVEWVEDLPSDQRTRLRLVYNTGCWNVEQGPHWLELGAETYVGHPGASASPVFYYFMLRRWTAGETLAQTVADSWQKTRSVLTRTAPFYESLRSLDELLAETEPHCSGGTSLSIGDTRQ